MLLTFLYSHRTTTCPVYGALIRSALASLGDGSDDLRFVAVSVDPERDTVARLAEYTVAAAWPSNWYFLTGTPEKVRETRSAYRIAASKKEPEAGTSHADHIGYEVAHRAAVFVIDRSGAVVDVLLGHEWDSNDLAAIVGPILQTGD